MLKPKTPCQISTLTGFSQNGRSEFAPPKNERCSVVNLTGSLERTNPNKSASAGNAQTKTLDSTLLFSPATLIGRGDQVTVGGFNLFVKTIRVRHQLSGKTDHIEVTLNASDT